MAYFVFDGHRLAYTVHGEGPRTTVLTPGLLLSQKMQTPLAKELAARGNRVVTFDPLGHGASDRPAEMWRYSMPAFARQLVALLDHLEVDQSIVGGTSLGANITLEVASLAPDRLRGMVIEMPVLDHAIPACGAAFTPMLFALTFGERLMKALARGARAVPREPVPFLLQLGLDWVAQDPRASAAVLQGILFGRTAPDRNERVKFDCAGARDRPPTRPSASVLGRRHARSGAAKRAPDRRQLNRRAAAQARAADRQDRGVRRSSAGAAATRSARTFRAMPPAPSVGAG